VARKLGYQQQRELDGLPARLDALGAEIRTLETKLADPGLFARDPDAFQRTAGLLSQRQAELHAAEERWLELEALRENLDGA
jgi:ATP-binding cassette subfamily F protein uup